MTVTATGSQVKREITATGEQTVRAVTSSQSQTARVITTSAIAAPVNTVAPAITGTPEVGEELTCSTGTWTGTGITYSYQWKRDGSNISGATSSTYTLVEADAETDVLCTVTATNSVGSTEANSNTVSISAAIFTATFNTANTEGGSSGSDELILPIISTNEITIDWGDGSSLETIPNPSAVTVQHTYGSSGTYTVEIFTTSFFYLQYYDNTANDKLKITNITNISGLRLINHTFDGCTNLNITSTAIPQVTADLRSCFHKCSSLTYNYSINNWDVSSVTNMYKMFEGATSFNQDLDQWDVSNCGNMARMFRNAQSFNGNITTWTITKNLAPSDEFRMFDGATSFNQDLNGWDMSLTTNFVSVFSNCHNFNQALNWDLTAATSARQMFRGATAINSNLNNMDVSTIQDFERMFQNATAFNGDITGWDVSSAVTFRLMFFNSPFNRDIGGWDTSSLENTESMFRDATAFDQDIGTWDVTSLTNANTMFINLALSTANYDALLIGWENQLVQNSVVFHGGNSKYTAGGAAETARTNLINNHSWTITDGGPV